MSEQVERSAILAMLQPIVKDGLKYALRRLPPPGGGWLVHIKESDLQEHSDQKREDIIVRVAEQINSLNSNGVPVGVVRTLE